MSSLKIGILREGKNPPDRRVPFTPAQCKKILDEFPGAEFFVQPSPFRCYTDAEYKQQGINVTDDLSHCEWLMGIKEVPKEQLIPGKKYLFFSHTIKKQPHNRELLKKIIENKITLIDYECLVDKEGNRVIGFGRYAGIVGACNGIMAYGLKYNLFNLKSAHLCHDKKEVFGLLKNVKLPNIKIIVTGGGRVSNGACETLGAMEMRRVTPYEFLHYSFREPVYVQLHSHDYHESKDQSPYSKFDFYNHPEGYVSTFCRKDSFGDYCDILIHCSYWDPRSPQMFTKEEMKDPGFHISVIADVTCDLNGSIPSTTKVSTIEDKFYGYNPYTEEITKPFDNGVITVMAIDNLPCELPRDSSEGFGKHLMERVLPDLLGGDKSGLIERATIADNGNLTQRFGYLEDYAL